MCYAEDIFALIFRKGLGYLERVKGKFLMKQLSAVFVLVSPRSMAVSSQIRFNNNRQKYMI